MIQRRIDIFETEVGTQGNKHPFFQRAKQSHEHRLPFAHVKETLAVFVDNHNRGGGNAEGFDCGESGLRGESDALPWGLAERSISSAKTGT